MQRKKINMLWVLILLMLMVSACNVSSPTASATAIPLPDSQATKAPVDKPLPTETQIPPATQPTETAEPTATFTPLVIEPENAKNLTVIAILPFTYPYQVVYANDNATIMVHSSEFVKVYDANSFAMKKYRNIEAPEILLDASPEGNIIATTQDNQTLNLIDVVEDKTIQTIHLDSPFLGAQFSYDGATIGLELMDSMAIQVLDVKTGEILATYSGFQTAAPVYSARILAKDNLVWFSRGLVQVMDMKDMTLSQPFGHEDFVSAIALTSDGKILATSAGQTVNDLFQPVINLWNPESGEKMDTLIQANPISSMAFSPDNHLLAAGSQKDIYIIDMTTHKIVMTLEASTESVNSLCFSPDGTTLVNTSSDGKVKAWKVIE